MPLKRVWLVLLFVAMCACSLHAADEEEVFPLPLPPQAARAPALVSYDPASNQFHATVNNVDQILNTGSASGTTTNQVAHAISTNSSGTPTAVDSVVCTPPAVNGQYTVGYTVTASAAVAPTCPQVGLAARGVAGTTDTVLYTDNNDIVIYESASATAVTGPVPATLSNNNFFTITKDHGAGTVTITPTSPWTISLNGATAGTSAAVYPQQTGSLYVDPTTGTQWDLDTTDAAGYFNGVAYTVQGTDSKLLSAGTVSGSTGVSLCTDAQHGATTSGCPTASLAPICTSQPAAGAYTPAGTANAVECLSAGTYTLPTSVTTLSNNNTVIYCSTAAAIIERGSGASGIIFSGNNSGIIGCTLDDGAFTSSARFVSLTGNYDFIRNTVHQDPGAVGTTPTYDVSGSATNAVIAYNQFLGSQTDDCITINFAGTTSGTIKNTVIDHNYISSFAANGICFYVQQASGASVFGTQITLNYISVAGASNNGVGIKFLGPTAEDTNFEGSVVDGNYIVASARITTMMQAFGFIGAISNNTFNTNSQIVTHGLYLGDLYDSTVVGNIVFASTSGDGITCTDCARNTFSGNIVKGMGGNDGALAIFTGSATASDYNSITGNSIFLAFGATCYELDSGTGGAAVSYNTITGNICNGNSQASEYGVQVLETAGAAVGNQITGNTFQGMSGTSSTAINIGSGPTNTVVGQNVFDGNTAIIADSGTTSQIVTHTVVGSGPLVSGSPSTLAVTFSGYQLFATGKYQCTVNDQTTAATALKVTYSTNTVTFTGPNTNTDTVGYICAGY